eukprot:CAMPEP_0172176828 /NCGR_PEP_ID=MMETSP1050-20130122/15062_1 /TAXON_ID=233186 /ORGANISM="Cryptomonas curvata, Strain CCAP979/52" /LENGTH=309 /DNA_ID=CAMNT_0012849209 /DNA_START=383 /DNA_END=1312 /DNA_ORIENTATION=-
MQGAALEAFFDGEWWEADIIQLQDDHVMIHYVGGNEDEDEWILKTSDRLRPPQPAIMPEGSSVTTVITKKHSISGLNVRELDDHQRSKSADQRPMRQSRILSNDSRLAMQLQEQEVMAATAARGKAIHNRKKSRTQSHRRSTKSIVVERSANPAPASCDSSESIHDAEITLKSLQSSEWKQPSSPVNASAEGGVSLYKKQKKSHKGVVSEDGSGMVSFCILPDESSSSPLPPLKQSRICLPEDSPVFQVKRLIMDEVLPEICAAQIVIRTEAGMHVGQDHSLRYVRTILWPKSRGELVLKYSIGKALLL